MSADRDLFKVKFYVVHKFGRHRRGRHQVCERCGTKRRSHSSGWEWLAPGKSWTSANPLCAMRPVKP